MIPRRNILSQLNPAELSIYNAIQEVEKMIADPKLTEVVIKLTEAKKLLSDYVGDVLNKIQK